MSLTCEHFVYGLVNGNGYKLLATSNVERWISKKNLFMLEHIGDGTTARAIYQVYLPDDQVLAVSMIDPAQDEYKRKGVWNHTILMKIKDYINVMRPSEMLRDHFITGDHDKLNPNAQLKPIVIQP